jgi:hypothetical protein
MDNLVRQEKSLGRMNGFEWVDPKWQNENSIINPFALYFGGGKKKKKTWKNLKKPKNHL